MAIKDAALRSQILAYIGEAKQGSSVTLDKAVTRAVFRKIFHVSLSFEAVAGVVSSPGLQPSLAGARSLGRRLPLLVGLGQLSAAQGELRRLLELVAWTIYFTDHKREWREFSSASAGGFTQNQRTPIAYAAHREASFYIEYLDELMLLDKSKLGKQAVEQLKHVHHRLNAVIHPGGVARGLIPPPFDEIHESKLESFHTLLRDALSSAAILLCAFRSDRFNRMPAGPKGHFLYLLSTAQKHALSKGDFGIP